jgi:hypothetical protein
MYLPVFNGVAMTMYHHKVVACNLANTGASNIEVAMH